MEQKQTATGTILGTPLYMPPEQWEGKADVDGRVDIYALGIILYECLTGAPPFDAKSAMQLMYAHTTKEVPDLGAQVALPEPLRRLVLDMVHKRPEDRPASMGVVETALRQLQAELASSSPAAGSADGAVPWSSVAAGPPRPMAGTGDPVLSMTAEPSMTGLGSLAGSLGGGMAASLTPAKPATAAAVPSAPAEAAPAAAPAGERPPPTRRLRAFLLVGGATLAVGAAVAVTLTLRGPVSGRRAVTPVSGTAQTAPAAASRAAPATPLVELGPGRFLIGRPGASTLSDGPAYAVEVARFSIEAYEVSVAQLAEYAQATRQAGLLATEAATGRNLPAVRVSRDQAMRYCTWRHRGGRLPTEAEWEFAARDGRGDSFYPWSGPAGGAADSLMATRANLGSPRPQLEPVDSHPAGATSRGVHNLLGNAAEWTLSDSAPYPGSRAVVPRGLAVVRGGSAITPVRGLQATTRQFVSAGRTDPFIGFRCVVSAR